MAARTVQGVGKRRETCALIMPRDLTVCVKRISRVLLVCRSVAADGCFFGGGYFDDLGLDDAGTQVGGSTGVDGGEDGSHGGSSGAAAGYGGASGGGGTGAGTLGSGGASPPDS